MENKDRFGVAIIGSGNVGTRRAETAAGAPQTRLVTCVDASEDRAKALAERFGSEYDTDWRRAVNRPDVDIVVASTGNNLHAPISIAAMQNGKHVLCEKPLARDPNEAETMVFTAVDNRVRLKTGLTHRYHNAVIKAKELLDSGAIGSAVFMRGWTGRGGWETFTQSWFVDPELSGGGTLMDNGQTLLDLTRMLMGSEFKEAMGYRTTNMRPIAPAEDNAYGIFKTDQDQVATLHSSWTQWSGYLSLEITGTEGYIIIDLDSSRTVLGTRSDRWAPIQEQVFDFSAVPDTSWSLEWQEFINAITETRDPNGSGYDGWKAVAMAYAVYESSESGKAVMIP